jgi:hypothetical protein
MVGTEAWGAWLNVSLSGGVSDLLDPLVLVGIELFKLAMHRLPGGIPPPGQRVRQDV